MEYMIYYQKRKCKQDKADDIFERHRWTTRLLVSYLWHDECARLEYQLRSL